MKAENLVGLAHWGQVECHLSASEEAIYRTKNTIMSVSDGCSGFGGELFLNLFFFFFSSFFWGGGGGGGSLAL